MELKRLKICIFGDPGVGCTSLIMNFLNLKPEDLEHPMAHARIFKKSVMINDIKTEITLFDLYGPRVRFSPFPMKPFFYDAKGGILVYDITNIDSFKGLKEWIKECRNYCGEIPTVIIGNKLDIENKRLVSKEDVRDIVQQYNVLKHLEVSAKISENVEEAFMTLIQEITI